MICSMLRRNSRRDIVIFFWAASFSLVCVDHVGLKGQDVHLNWFDVLEPGCSFLKLIFQKRN